MNTLKIFLAKHLKLTLLFIFTTLAVIMVAFLINRKREHPFTTNPSRGPVIEAVYGLGKVKSYSVFDFKPGVSVRVTKFYVNEGETVKKGKPLLMTDGGHNIRAPFDGVISSVPVNTGENVMPGFSLIRLTDPSNVYIDVALNQEDALRVKEKQKVTVTFESLRGVKIQGLVLNVFSKNEEEFHARVEVAGLPPEILPGMTADVSIEVGRREAVLLVPVQAVHSGQIHVFRRGLIKKIRIQAGLSDGEFIEILSPPLDLSEEICIPYNARAVPNAN